VCVYRFFHTQIDIGPSNRRIDPVFGSQLPTPVCFDGRCRHHNKQYVCLVMDCATH